MKKILAIGLILLSPWAYGKEKPPVEAPKKSPIALNNVETDVDNEETLVTLTFSDRLPIENPSIEDHGTFLNLPLPDIVIPEPGKFYEGKGPYITKLATFQFSPDHSALRIFLKHDAAEIKKAVSLNVLNDRLVIAVNHKILADAGIVDHLASKKAPTADEVIQKTSVNPEIDDPALLVKNQSNTQTTLRKNLTAVSIFSGVMLIGLFLFHTFWGRYKRRDKNSADQITMKTLATYSLAPKRDIALVQVGSQKILLGVSQDNISFLTNIVDQQQSSFQAMLMAGGTQSQSYPQSNPQINPQRKAQPALSESKEAASPKKKNPGQPVRPKPPIRNIASEEVAKSPAVQVDLNASGEGRRVAMSDVTNLIRQKLKDLPSI